MNVEGILRRRRLAREQLMRSRVRVRRPTGDTEARDGVRVPVWADEHTNLPMQLSGAGTSSPSTTKTVGGVEFEVAARMAEFPAGTSNLRDNDYVDIQAGEHAGLVLRVVEADGEDLATALRVSVVAVARPEEW